MSEKKLFARKATGLVREIGMLTAAIIILCNVMGLGWQKRIFQYSMYLPENYWVAGIPPMVMAFIIGGIVILFSVFAFSILIAAMPRSGGGYVVISRLVSPFWAFVGSWFEFLSIAWSFGLITVAIFEGLNDLGGVAGLTPGYNEGLLFWGGVVILLLFTAIGCLGVRMAGTLLQILFWIPAVLTVYVIFLLASALANPAIVATGLAAVGQAQGLSGVTPATYVSAAIQQGMDKGALTDYWSAVSVSMIGAYFAYIGYAASTFVAGEVKEANKSLPRVLLLSSVIIIVMYVIVSTLGAYATTALGVVTLPNGHVWSLFEAWGFLSYKGSLSAAGVPTISGWTTTVAAMTGLGMGLGNLNILLVLFGVLWVTNDIPPFILTASRILFAMAFDRVLPASLANVNERFHSPVNATIVTGVFGLLGVVSETISDFGNGMLGTALKSIGAYSIFAIGVASTDLFDAVFFTLFALALVFLPFRKKTIRIFETAPFKIGGKMGMAAIGVAGVIANLVLDWMILTSPKDAYNILAPTSDNWIAIGFTVFLGIVGALMYWYYKYGPSRKEVDYATIFAEIPPE